MMSRIVWTPALCGIAVVGLLVAGCSKEAERATVKAAKPETKAPAAPKVEKKAAPAATKPAMPTKPTTTAIAQKTCPVMGGPIDPNVFVMHEGKKVYFCCKECIPKFEKEPAKYMAKLK
jgi:YHS domain-containing protein